MSTAAARPQRPTTAGSRLSAGDSIVAALAIELAAARLPALGLDGLEAGLGDRLRMLAGGSRIDNRHRSLRSALDWSFALLDRSSQAVLGLVSVFATPFTAQDAVALATGCAGGP